LADLKDLYRILYILYEAYHEDRTIALQDLQMNILPFMHKVGNLVPSLKYLQKTGYVEGSNDDLQLTGAGLKATISIFQKFLDYIKRDYPDKLSQWIGVLGYYKENNWELIRNSFFHIQKEPLLHAAFGTYLSKLGSLDNLNDFGAYLDDIGYLIEDIFINIHEINSLFEMRFKCRLFCPPVAAQSFMSRATRGEINLTDLTTSVGLILDGICTKDIDVLIGKAAKDIPGSINKIEKLLVIEGISFKQASLRTLRTLHHVRNTIFPVHSTGTAEIHYLRELNVEYPIIDRRDAALKMLWSLNSALLEMKVWFLPDHNAEEFDYHS
jgi:hypothetical protein